jgi:hypothetical protein
MEIDRTISKWFRETADKMNTVSKPDEPAYDLCSTVLPLSHNYSDAILLLINKGKKLPAMALIRVLAELTLRFIWCLFPNERSEDVDTRIRRWLKESHIQEKRNLKKISPLANPQKRRKIDARIKSLDNKINVILHKSAGDLYGSLEDLVPTNSRAGKKFPSWKADVYPLLYTPFNMAVHPDFTLFSYLVKETANKRHFCGDLVAQDTNELKICCMRLIFDIIATIYSVYKWDYRDIKKEYFDNIKRFKT